MKRTIAWLITAVLLIGATAGCADSGETAPAASAESAATQPAAPATPGEYTLPLTEEKVTLSYFVEVDESKIGIHHKDYNGLLQYQKFEEATNVHIEFIHPPAGQATEQFNLLLASNNRPDMMYYNKWLQVAGGPDKLVKDGLFLDLAPRMAELAPDLYRFYQEHPEIEKMVKTDQGVHYVFPSILYDQDVKNSSGFMGRNDWLTELGLEPPTTIAEWETAFEAFKSSGLGNEGAAPFICRNTVDDTSIYTFAGAWGINPHLYLDPDGNVQYGALTPAYVEFVKTMARWYENGYLSPDFNSIDYKQQQARVLDSMAFSWNDGISMGFDTYVKPLGGDPEVLFVTTYPTLEEGVTAKYFYSAKEYSGVGAAVSASSEYPELCMRWLNYAYTPEGHMIANFGEEGFTYTMVDGEPVLSDDILHHPEYSVSIALGRYALGASLGPFVHSKYVRNQRLLFWPGQVEAIQKWKEADSSQEIPLVTYTDDEASRAADYQNEIKTYVDEMTLKFIMGQLDVDAEHESFINTLTNTMDVNGYIELVSGAVTRYNSR